jgi:hypothetical protein
MMATYLVFLKNTVTHEEFVAPLQAAKREEAMARAAAAYPAPAYSHLTCYGMDEMQRIMADVQRWPGVASKVQPTLETLMRNVRDNTARGLPPMPTRTPVQAAAVSSPAAPPATPGVVVSQGPRAAGTATNVVDALRAARATQAVVNHTQDAPRPAMPAPAPAVSVSAAAPKVDRMAPMARPQSVIDVLKAMRGGA